MISFPELGNMGRLGNQLFQMAAAISLALEHNEGWVFPPWEHEEEFPALDDHHFREDLPPGPEYKEPTFSYRPIPYEPGLRLTGFFQSEKYFRRRAHAVRHYLTPAGLGHVVIEGCASIHVRRTDYIGKEAYHRPLGLDYYEKAIRYLRDYGVDQFFVFSDDPEWCLEHFPQQLGGGTLVYMPKDPPVDDLVRMARLEHHIIANSSYSWWAAWFCPNPNKVVIAPKFWFGPEGPKDDQDICPGGWVRL
jgi:hypothetical protein